MKHQWTVAARKAPRRVVLSHQRGQWELRPLEAAWLAGHLFFHALEAVNESGRLGSSMSESASIILWQEWGSGCWNPSWISSTDRLRREVRRCREQGIQYRITLDLVADPLADPDLGPKGGDEI